jgi:hypothetical protein
MQDIIISKETLNSGRRRSGMKSALPSLCESSEFLITKYCTKCKIYLDEEFDFCAECGDKLIEKKKSNRGVKQKIIENDKAIKQARGVCLFVSIMTFAVAIFQYFSMEKELEKIRKAGDQVNQVALREFNITLGVIIVLAIVFIFLFFWAKTQPFKACLIGLILYTTDWLVNIALEPSNLSKGVFIKIFVIIALVNGVRASLQKNTKK